MDARDKREHDNKAGLTTKRKSSLRKRGPIRRDVAGIVQHRITKQQPWLWVPLSVLRAPRFGGRKPAEARHASEDWVAGTTTSVMAGLVPAIHVFLFPLPACGERVIRAKRGSGEGPIVRRPSPGSHPADARHPLPVSRGEGKRLLDIYRNIYLYPSASLMRGVNR